MHEHVTEALELNGLDLDGHIAGLHRINEREGEYLEALEADFRDSLRWCHHASNPTSFHGSRSYWTIAHTSEFDAYIQKLDGDDRSLITFSTGVLKSLDDLFLRAVNNMDFLSLGAGDRGRTWPGEKCVWMSNPFFFPNVRFVDYRYRALDYSQASRVFDLSRFENLLPISMGRHCYVWTLDEHRRKLASRLLEFSLLWIYMHEENHLLLGHIDYLASKYRKDGDEEKFGENERALDPEQSAVYSRVRRNCEWDADRLASEDMVRVLFSEEYVDIVPPALGHSALNLWRIIFVSIGVVCLLFQKSRSVLGDSEYYTSPKSRMATAAIGMVSALDNRSPEGQRARGMFDADVFAAVIEGFYLALYDLWVLGDVLYVETDDLAFKLRESSANVENPVDAYEIPALVALFVSQGEVERAAALGIASISEIQTSERAWFSEIKPFMAEFHSFRNHFYPGFSKIR